MRRTVTKCEHDVEKYRLIGIIIWALDSYLKDLKLSPFNKTLGHQADPSLPLVNIS